MTRLAFFLALALLAACAPRPSGLSPDAAFRASLQATERGDVPQALALLREAADAGHLDALALRAQATRRGYLRTGYGQGYRKGVLPANHAFLVLPGEPEEAERAYRRALHAAAASDDPDALFTAAFALTESQWTGSEWTVSATARDSARTIYRRLVAAGADPGRLAALAWTLDDHAAHRRHLDDAVQAGDGQACWRRLWTEKRPLATAAGFADFVDDAEACPPPPPGPDPVADDVRALAGHARSGNAAAVALLDSVRQSGVFERHPRLAEAASAGL